MDKNKEKRITMGGFFHFTCTCCHEQFQPEGGKLYDLNTVVCDDCANKHEYRMEGNKIDKSCMKIDKNEETLLGILETLQANQVMVFKLVKDLNEYGPLCHEADLLEQTWVKTTDAVYKQIGFLRVTQLRK